ncbi:MAG: hypothetical protein ACRDD7_17290 [Peptostreptococcaceae bacterium]
MDKKIINGREYVEVEIQSIEINGVSRDNRFNINDITDSNRISININVSEKLSDTIYSTLSSETENTSAPITTKSNIQDSKIYIFIAIGVIILASILYITLG